ncbi:MAG: cupin domain-containing protein [Solirubrobacteraceae bacterium]
MATTGATLTNPVTGQAITFRRTTADSGGDVLEVESRWPAGGGKEPPAHYHPRQAEHFEVLSGDLEVRLDGERRTLRAGESLDVPAGARHSMWNGSDAETSARWATRPALQTEAFFEAFWGLAQDGKVTKAGLPEPLQAAVLLREFKDEFRLARPPRLVQDLAFGSLAVIGRAAGRPRRYVSESTSR